MSQNSKTVKLGVIICKHCNCFIEEVDTQRVQIFYSTCDQESCKAVKESKDAKYANAMN